MGVQERPAAEHNEFVKKRPLRRDACGILAQGQRIAVGVEHVSEALEDRLHPLSLACSFWKSQLAAATAATGALVSLGRRYRQ